MCMLMFIHLLKCNNIFSLFFINKISSDYNITITGSKTSIDTCSFSCYNVVHYDVWYVVPALFDFCLFYS